jgi:APA family basic amino acid/polyamine antiporter
MPKELERDLGFYATVTISIGAMVGSGIFVLPGLAAAKAGPAVVLAYLLAGVVVLPAALSKAEMATAMPESGGTYLFIDRAMGPLPGTIAELGAWFSLVFKSAFALVGLGAYLLLFVQLSTGLVKLVALALGLLLVVVNTVGVKQTGRLQAAIVTVVLSVVPRHRLYDALSKDQTEQIAERLSTTTVLVKPHVTQRESLVRHLVEQRLF